MGVWPVNTGVSRIFKYFFLKSKKDAAWTEAVQAEKYDVDITIYGGAAPQKPSNPPKIKQILW